MNKILNAIQLFSAAEKIIEKEIEQKKNWKKNYEFFCLLNNFLCLIRQQINNNNNSSNNNNELSVAVPLELRPTLIPI